MTTPMIEKLDRATHQRRWTDELMAWRDEAAERWAAAWTEWREATEQFDDAASVTVLPEKWPSVEDLGRWEFAVYFQSLKWLWPSEAIITMAPPARAKLPAEPIKKQAPSFEVLPNTPTNVVVGWIPRRPSDVMAELYEQRFNPVQQYMDADSGDDMPGRWPIQHDPRLLALAEEHAQRRSQVQTGPQGRFGRWLDEQLQRPGRWWRRKQAERDARMGLED
jgi:hypothetical protein